MCARHAIPEPDAPNSNNPWPLVFSLDLGTIGGA